MARKARAAWRTSRAPCGRSGASMPLPKASAADGQALDGPHLVADEEDGDAGEEHAGQRQPDDEDVAVGGEHPVLGRDDADHALRNLEPDVDVGGIARGVEPERPADALGERLGERAVHRPDQGRAAAARQDRRRASSPPTGRGSGPPPTGGRDWQRSGRVRSPGGSGRRLRRSLRRGARSRSATRRRRRHR